MVKPHTTTFKMPYNVCPYCDWTLEECKSFDPYHLDPPQTGDLSVCPCCGGFLSFNAALQSEPLQVAALAALAVDQPEDYQQLLASQQAVLLSNPNQHTL